MVLISALHHVILFNVNWFLRFNTLSNIKFKHSLMNKNLPFTVSTKIADVIHLDYRLIPIIGRFGIEYGFRNKTVAEVCAEYEINSWFFLEIVNSYHNSEYFPKKQLRFHF